MTYDAVGAEWTLAVSDNGKGKQQCASTGSGLGTAIVAALASRLNALVVTASSPEGTSVSVAHRGKDL